MEKGAAWRDRAMQDELGREIIAAVTGNGLVGIDLSDVQIFLDGSCYTVAAKGEAAGMDCFTSATHAAVDFLRQKQPWIDDAISFLSIITGGNDMMVEDVDAVVNIIADRFKRSDYIMTAAIKNKSMMRCARVTLVAAREACTVSHRNSIHS